MYLEEADEGEFELGVAGAHHAEEGGNGVGADGLHGGFAGVPVIQVGSGSARGINVLAVAEEKGADGLALVERLGGWLQEGPGDDDRAWQRGRGRRENGGASGGAWVGRGLGPWRELKIKRAKL